MDLEEVPEAWKPARAGGKGFRTKGVEDKEHSITDKKKQRRIDEKG